jgi:hypothetical protein
LLKGLSTIRCAKYSQTTGHCRLNNTEQAHNQPVHRISGNGVIFAYLLLFIRNDLMKLFLDWPQYENAGLDDACADIPKHGGNFAKPVKTLRTQAMGQTLIPRCPQAA